MNWRDYEEAIYDYYKGEYPEALITKNAHIKGRYSKVDRQIDVLIESDIAGVAFRLAVDAKHRGRRIDVKDVESFIGFCADIGAHAGVLISPKGYSAAAIRRAHLDQAEIQLDVLHFGELRLFQADGAIVFSGRHGALLRAPFGWVVDGTKRAAFLAALYQRSQDIQSAASSNQWMYVNLLTKTPEINSMDALIAHQAKYLFQDFPLGELTYFAGPFCSRGKTKIRRFFDLSYPAPEYTGFIEFNEFILFCVLFTTIELEALNLQKLKYVLRNAMPLNVRIDEN
jgi:Restriction endonuclease